MEKSQSSKQQSQRTCLGTKEWSKTSGICRGCDLKNECSKINSNKD